jgi:hypothetical protein
MSAEMANEIKLISGRSHPELSENIAKRYDQIPLSRSPTRPIRRSFEPARRSLR